MLILRLYFPIQQFIAERFGDIYSMGLFVILILPLFWNFKFQSLCLLIISIFGFGITTKNIKYKVQNHIFVIKI